MAHSDCSKRVVGAELEGDFRWAGDRIVKNPVRCTRGITRNAPIDEFLAIIKVDKFGAREPS